MVRSQGNRDTALNQEVFKQEIEKKTQKIRMREEEIAMKLLSAARHRDHETASHVRRVGLYAEVMAKALKWDDTTTADIRIAALIHDIGKIGTQNYHGPSRKLGWHELSCRLIRQGNP